MVSNLGKSRSPLVWYPMSRANLQDSDNPKPIMMGIAEEPPHHLICVMFLLSIEMEMKRNKKMYFNVKTNLGAMFGRRGWEATSRKRGTKKNVSKRSIQ
jgi:hypothetical protein